MSYKCPKNVLGERNEIELFSFKDLKDLNFKIKGEIPKKKKKKRKYDKEGVSVNSNKV